jgi:hypothetical protein
MGTAARARVSPETRKAHTGGTVRASTNFINSSTNEDNLTARRAQRLISTFGMTKRRARVVVDLAWEAAHG